MLVDTPTWTDSVSFLTSLVDVPAASANAQLLVRARSRWEGRVQPRTSMHDLLFTMLEASYPFDRKVRVAWRDGVFTLSLIEQGSLTSSRDAHEDTAAAVLDDFLARLAG